MLTGEKMALDYYIQSGGKRLRCGFTTGTCAALAAAGAASGLLTGALPDHMSLVTPAGIPVEVPLVRVKNGVSSVCGVCKDAGDDRDATDGILIVAEASYGEDSTSDTAEGYRAKGGKVSAAEGYCAKGSKVSAAEGYCAKGGKVSAAEGYCAKGSKVSAAEGYCAKGSDENAAEASCLKDSLTDDTNVFSGITVRIEGGPGVGRVTKPGLDQPVGAAAINSTPRRMIEDAVRKVCELSGYEGTLYICISVPDGEKIAAKTFNGHLGIEGGISILGTSGIVKPMSMQAYTDAINVEIRQQAALGNKKMILTPGNYGKNFLHEMREKSIPVPIRQDENPEDAAGSETSGYRAAGSENSGADPRGIEAILHDPSVPVVLCSNFIGDALDSAGIYGFDEVLLAGHIGKMVKLAGGIMNTHSMYADCRTDLFCAHAAICGVGAEVCREIMSAATTDACLEILDREGMRDAVMNSLMTAICGHVSKRVSGKYRIHVLVFSNVFGILGIRTIGEEAYPGKTCF